MEKSKIKETIIVGDLQANEKNYREVIDGLADVMMWMLDGCIKMDDDLRESALQTLAHARGHLQLIVQNLKQDAQ